jgi:hypothetical protein
MWIPAEKNMAVWRAFENAPAGLRDIGGGSCKA